MIASRTIRSAALTDQVPPVPLTVEGYSVLHQMFRFRWSRWRELAPERKVKITEEIALLLEQWGQSNSAQSALYSLLGHKGDLMLVHFRQSFDELNRAEIQLAQIGLNEFLEPASSYLSVIELGLYESSLKTYRELLDRGIEPYSEEWKRAVAETLDRQREAMRPRLFPDIPASRYVCFYPMDRRRGEEKNWYTLPIEERARQMNEHGLVGRRYAGQVKQIITGSIGFDDWEWGVDLFADDPLVFKKLIYEMRFDEVSAVYAQFGHFFVGVRCQPDHLNKLLNGELPG
ncbi:MAG TPA: hydrogen peroxide-dependent heme synthase [Terriglobales bacterium]|nr:hydrogen peroxide-dependent heme synthase [Terriglobales bacterium]